MTNWSLNDLAWSWGQEERRLRGRLGDSRGQGGQSRRLGDPWCQQRHLMICKAAQVSKRSKGVKGDVELSKGRRPVGPRGQVELLVDPMCLKGRFHGYSTALMEKIR